MRTPLLSLFCLLCSLAFAQDTLFYANGKYVTGQVEEIGSEQVRYRTRSGDGSVLVVAEKSELERIKLQGGQEFNVAMAVAEKAPSAEFMKRKQALSLDVIAPALNHATIGYERVVGERMNLVIKAGYIGLGLWENQNYYNTRYSGGLMKVGLKFILPRSNRRAPSFRDTHPLAGWYLRPEIMVSIWSERDYYGAQHFAPEDYTTDYSSAAFNLIIGRQIMLGERCTFDLFGGIGYGAEWQGRVFNNPNSYYYNKEAYAFSHAFISNRSPLAFSGGLMFGYAF